MQFFKYQGAGNDFIMVDQRRHRWLDRADTDRISLLCNRHWGIGADGLILLQSCSGYDFEMIYFNADGRESTMCGNGGRCIAAFARHLGLERPTYRFLAIDGPHEALIPRTTGPGGAWVELKMGDVRQVDTALYTSQEPVAAYILNTGSPHFVRFVPQVNGLDMVQEGRAVRFADAFREAGINVNLVEETPEQLIIRTYERGVEDETLACGTGVTAAALAHFRHKALPAGSHEIPVLTRGGQLIVRFLAHPDGTFSDIWLCGPAQRVFSGEIEI